MREILTIILLILSLVVSAQTYEVSDLFILDSVKVGISTNSVWLDTAKAGSMVFTIDRVDYFMDGYPQILDSLLSFEVSAHDKDTAIITAVGFDPDATSYQLRYLEGLIYPTLSPSTGTTILTSSDSTAFQGLKVAIDVPVDNTNYAFRLFSILGGQSMFNSDTTQLDSLDESYTIYYVSSSSGNNGNNGLSEGQAWETLVYAEANATTPGCMVALRMGDTWILSAVFNIETSGTEGNYITWNGNSWGSGERATITTTYNGGSSSTQLIRIRECSYFIFEQIIIDIDDHNVEGLGIVSGWDTGDDSTHHITIQDCTVKDVGNGTLYQVGIRMMINSCGMTNITLLRDSVYNYASHGISLYHTWETYLPPGETEGRAEDIYVGYCYIANGGEHTGNTRGMLGINGESVNVIYEYNKLVDDGESSQGIYVGAAGHEDLHPDSITFRYNEIHMKGGPAIQLSPGTEELVETMHIDVYGNIIFHDGNNGYERGIRITSGAWDNSIINVYNNTIYTENEIVGFMDDAGATASVTYRNNIVYTTGTRECARFTASTTHDHNIYYSTASGNPGLMRLVSALQYRDDIGTWEPTGFATDPEFTVEFTNLNLQTGSDAIDGGVAITSPPTIFGYTEDIDGVAVGSSTNIGVKETTEDP